MFEAQILRLHEQGLTSAVIANRVGCSPGYVRSVAWHQGFQAKPIYDPVVEPDPQQHQAALAAASKALAKANTKARRAEVEAKRAKLLRKLAAVETQLKS
ncbi:hypothetical protein [Mycobacterium sp. 852002-10029_SCH5224772]|uniref:hypothetical protein n=1 Tax=Mycobacterium sp. 852002-10029_SCH5224772 TaxID=1834083 RepID=UPI000800944B|nr:hypothetical protein [Mycobacterium sp. 852002-10029_SCH5224772]OBF01891.1 hypothetical protein A5775_03495 [Mycobacterium sp. 852002-10029_SCH5224772]